MSDQLPGMFSTMSIVLQWEINDSSPFPEDFVQEGCCETICNIIHFAAEIFQGIADRQSARWSIRFRLAGLRNVEARNDEDGSPIFQNESRRFFTEPAGQMLPERGNAATVELENNVFDLARHSGDPTVSLPCEAACKARLLSHTRNAPDFQGERPASSETEKGT